MNPPKLWLISLLLLLVVRPAVGDEAIAAPNGLPNEPASAIEVMPLGFVHGSDVPEPNKLAWLALRGRGKHFELAEVVPKITAELDPEFDQPGTPVGRYSGRNVEVNGFQPIILLRSAILRPGPLATARPRGDWRRQTIPFNAKTYLLEQRCRMNEGTEQCEVSLALGSARQCLAYAFPSNDEFSAAVALVWTGDLDRDGRLDVILSIGTGRGAEGLAVYLSSMAAPGSLVRPVAGYLRGDC